jgi:hypothetical protein
MDGSFFNPNGVVEHYITSVVYVVNNNSNLSSCGIVVQKDNPVFSPPGVSALLSETSNCEICIIMFISDHKYELGSQIPSDTNGYVVDIFTSRQVLHEGSTRRVFVSKKAISAMRTLGLGGMVLHPDVLLITNHQTKCSYCNEFGWCPYTCSSSVLRMDKIPTHVPRFFPIVPTLEDELVRRRTIEQEFAMFVERYRSMNLEKPE